MPPGADAQLTLADLLVIAEAVTGESIAELAATVNVGSAESALAAPFASFGGVDFYPEATDQAAILCSRLVRNHPFPDGNKRVAWTAMRMTLAAQGIPFSIPDQQVAAERVEQLAAGDISEEVFALWVKWRTVDLEGKEEIPLWHLQQLATGAIQTANSFIDAVQGGDFDKAIALAGPELAAELRTSGAGERLREKWRQVDGSWGWTNPPEIIDVDCELHVLIEDGRTRQVREAGLVEGIPFVMKHGAEGWRVAALTPPAGSDRLEAS